MATNVRAEVSRKNPYYISKHRYYELKHFCLQYSEWKKFASLILKDSAPSSLINKERVKSSQVSDPAGVYGVLLSIYSKNMDLIERCAYEADRDLKNYIFLAVTEERSYTYLKSRLDMPCGKDMFYDRYRKFFYLLSKSKTY